MILKAVLFILLFCSVCPAEVSTATSGCFRVNNCKCIMKDGRGVINLKDVGDPDGFLGRLTPVRADVTLVQAETFLTFSPCQPFTQPEELMGSDCTDVAACLLIRYQRPNRNINRYVSFGSHEGNKFHYNNTINVLSVSYFAHSSVPLTVVHYHCNPNISASYIRDLSLSAERPLQVWVESPCACPNACTMGDLGLGAIFLIVLSLSAAAYFVIGLCALRPFRSSGGVQISPEPSVWCMICYVCAERRPRRRRRPLT